MSDWKKDQVPLSRVKADDMDAIGQSGAANLLRANADEIERRDIIYTDEINGLQNEIERLEAQVDSLQQRVHLCAGYDSLVTENERLNAEVSELKIRLEALADVAGVFVDFGTNGAEVCSQIAMAKSAVSAATKRPIVDWHSEFKKGEYVLATKYDDGDPGDHWAVGFYDRVLPKVSGDRHMVVNSDGDQFRGNGFRHVQRITSEQGEYLLGNSELIESNGLPVFNYLRLVNDEQTDRPKSIGQAWRKMIQMQKRIEELESDDHEIVDECEHKGVIVGNSCTDCDSILRDGEWIPATKKPIVDGHSEFEDNPCTDGHDFRPFRGSARCFDCGEMADCTETGAMKAATEQECTCDSMLVSRDCPRHGDSGGR